MLEQEHVSGSVCTLPPRPSQGQKEINSGADKKECMVLNTTGNQMMFLPFF